MLIIMCNSFSMIFPEPNIYQEKSSMDLIFSVVYSIKASSLMTYDQIHCQARDRVNWNQPMEYFSCSIYCWKGLSLCSSFHFGELKKKLQTQESEYI